MCTCSLTAARRRCHGVCCLSTVVAAGRDTTPPLKATAKIHQSNNEAVAQTLVQFLSFLFFLPLKSILLLTRSNMSV